MKKLALFFIMVLFLMHPAGLLADECMEGDCENGFGKGFTEEGNIYHGQWRNAEPHGAGKLFIGRDKVLEGRFENGRLVDKEKKAGEK